jgi:succinylarginine dihydrolase
VPTLRALGYAGDDAAVVAQAAREAPHLLARACSASAMWTANAATVTPSVDAGDGRVHLTVANLRAMPHRAIEPPQTARTLRAVFPDAQAFAVHDALPGTLVDGRPSAYGDEGAANHTRLTRTAAADPAEEGLHLFAYGMHADGAGRRPSRYPARQTYEASAAIAKRHGIPGGRCLFAQQHPAAIDQGVFHNDVIAVGNGNVLLLHELAFLSQERLLDDLQALLGPGFLPVIVPQSEVSVAEAVSTYLFNSQLLTLPDHSMVLVLPKECEEHPGVRTVVGRMLADPACPVAAAQFLDVRESMRNGGGPACLRLRVPLTPAERARVAPGCWHTPAQHARLVDWVTRRYREELAPADLADPALLRESRDALDELTQILGLGAIYDFQRTGGEVARGTLRA